MTTHAEMIRRLDRIADTHECDRPTASTRSPGFDALHGVGVAIYTCPTCQPMAAEIIRDCYGGVEHRPLPNPGKPLFEDDDQQLAFAL